MPRGKRKVEAEGGTDDELSAGEDLQELGVEPYDEFDLTTLEGVGPTIAKRLSEAGFTTLESIALTSPAELSAAAGIPASAATKIIAAARKILKVDVMTAYDYYRGGRPSRGSRLDLRRSTSYSAAASRLRRLLRYTAPTAMGSA